MATEYNVVTGDKVNIFWENVKAEFEVEVLYIPCATGDSWRLKRKDGTIIYVNSFSKMEVVSK